MSRTNQSTAIPMSIILIFLLGNLIKEGASSKLCTYFLDIKFDHHKTHDTFVPGHYCRKK